jgi:AraC-like DNA-binding protein
MEEIPMNRMRDSQLQLLWTARIDYAKGSKVDKHCHEDFHQLLVILSGECEVSVGDEKLYLSRESACLLFKSNVHDFYFTDHTVTLDYKFRIIDADFCRAVTAMHPFLDCRKTEITDLKRWYKLSLEQCEDDDNQLSYRIEVGLKTTLISLLINNAQHKHEKPALFKLDMEIDEYLMNNLGSKITLSQLSRKLGCNRNALINEFLLTTGMTPIQYLQKIRLEKAREYLSFTSLTMSEIADQVGWTLPYFSKIVKSKWGLSPSEYRSSLVNAVGKDIILEQDFLNEWLIKRE